MRGHRGRYPLLTDEVLISLVGVGDAFAFSALQDRHSRAIYSLAHFSDRTKLDGPKEIKLRN